MTIEWLAFQGSPHLQLNIPLAGYLVALVYAVAVLVLFIRSRWDFARLNARRWLLLTALLGFVPLATRGLVIHYIPAEGSPASSGAPLFFLPMLIAALWLGSGPALLIGMATGLMWTLFEAGRIAQPLELALLGALVGLMLGQRYRGAVGHGLRQPLMAMPIGALACWPLGLLDRFVAVPETLLTALERILVLAVPTLLSTLPAALVAGVILQGLLTAKPTWHPAHSDVLLAPPWQKRLTQRILYTLVPLVSLAVLILTATVASVAYRTAGRLVMDQMAQGAAVVNDQMSLFLQTGRGLLRDLTTDEQLLYSDGATRQRRLEHEIGLSSFFQQLLYFDAQGTLLDAYPASTDPNLSVEEAARFRKALLEGAHSEIITSTADGAAVVSFIVPVTDPQNGLSVGVLVGRSVLDTNPFVASALDRLHGEFGGTGEGFIVDEQNRILFYPAHPERQQRAFPTKDVRPIGNTTPPYAFRQQEPDGTRQIVYRLPVTSQPEWSVVVVAPNEVVLSQALQIALPVLLLLLVVSTMTVPLAAAFVGRLAAPLEQLLQAADRYAEGQLDHAVSVSGEDEMGRLGRAFEQMRIRLKSRLHELERLLNVSRHVSSNLELFRAMPPILNSALDVTGAIGVRIVLRGGDGEERQQAYAAGEAASAMALLDAQLLDLVEQQGTIVVSQIWRAAGSLDIANLLPRIRALVALPLRSETSFHGILWLSYDHEHTFEEAEMTFLSTLAGQAAVAITNAHLLARAEEGRRKLEAVLESTSDGIVVVDNEGRVVLMNPAAERYLGLQHETVLGRKAMEVIATPELAVQMADLREPTSALEIAGRDSKTLLATVSTIVGQNGTIGGRVAVLRDVTDLKKTDNLKTIFLRAVSHNLRSPLTYMKGYLSMLPLEGPVNERQQRAIGKVRGGIKNIEQMCERLTYLSRLTLSDTLEIDLKLVDVPTLIGEVYQQHVEMAREKGITLRLQIAEDLPLLLADEMLYSMAVTNLVENALKYTLPEGQVTIRAYVEDGDTLTVAVTDTGIGIRREDQARLFEAFYRAPQHPGDPERPSGQGLGLALVKAIAEVHGGKVGFESVFGRGSTFFIALPVRSPGE